MTGDLLNGNTLLIDAGGLKGGLRNKRDGFTFFGPCKENNKGEIINDYVINYKKEDQTVGSDNPITNGNVLKRLFVIFYDRFIQKYYFRNINDSVNKDKSLIFIKIEKNYIIERKKFFLIGHLLINLEPDYREGVIFITVFFKNDNNSKQFTFRTNESPITIGRVSSCKVAIDHSFLSKKQCVVEYDTIYRAWKLCDGHQNKKSTHGTWYIIIYNLGYW